MRMPMRRAMIVMMIAREKKSADDVDSETGDSDRDRLIEGDRHRMQNPHYAFIADQQCDEEKNDRRSEGGKIAEFACAEGEALVAFMAARETIGQGGDEKGAGMGRHMQTVGNQRHRIED